MNHYAYVTLLTDDSYIYGVMLLQESLKETNCQFPLEVLVTSNVSKPIINILNQMQISYTIIDPIIYENILEYNKKVNPAMARTWSLCLSKLNIFKFTQFDKLVFLDADIMVMKNLDHLFEYPHLTSALDGEYFNLWPGWDHFNSGILVIEPNIEEYNRIIDFIEHQALKESWKPGECIADQEILNHIYPHWPQQQHLHLNKYYDIFAPYIQEDQIPEIDKNCYFIHFVGRKPWRAFQKPPTETYTEKYYTIAHDMVQNKINTLNWDQAKDEIKVAVYGICKNEMTNIIKYLKCFSKADYLCILDTGSTDGTWEYLQEKQKQYPNLIIDQKIIDPWRYDAARNYSLTLVPKDTCMLFMVDLDEIIKDENWCLKIKDAWTPLFQRGMYTYHRFVDANTDQPLHTFNEFRIHAQGWHYEGIVHEQLINIGGTRGVYADEFITVPIAVWHYPTTQDKSVYIELCQRELKEHPDNWLMHLQLAAEYEVNNRYEEAIGAYKEIIISPNNLDIMEVGRCYASLGRLIGITKNKKDAVRIHELGITVCPNYADNYFLAAECYYQEKDFNKVIELCNAGIENSSNNYWCSLIKRDGYYPYLLMGASHFYLGNQIEGLGYLALAQSLNNSEEVNNIFNQMLQEINKSR